jgi:diguanylate cyclase (GGDEF)-like protein
VFEKLSKIFYLGVDHSTPDDKVRKFVLLNIVTIVTLLFLFIFGIYNTFFTNHYDIADIDYLAFVIFLYALYSVIDERTVAKASFIVTFNSFILLVALVYFVQGASFTLVWVIFFPLIAIFINGSSKGLVLSIIFYIVVFNLAYNGIGEWMDGKWDVESFSRFVAANIGMLFITYFFERSFEAAHKELAKNRRKEKQYITALKEASITDPLTQLYNRRHLDVMFHEKFLKAQANDSYFAFFILDIDHFKGYNDNYGHIAGDNALKAVADVLKESMRREADSVFRLGGEEFAGILMADKESKIFYVIENIRKNIEALQIEHRGSAFGSLTVSIGACIIKGKQDEDLDKMYKIADKALYEAKTQGRNQIRVDKISTL